MKSLAELTDSIAEKLLDVQDVLDEMYQQSSKIVQDDSCRISTAMKIVALIERSGFLVGSVTFSNPLEVEAAFGIDDGIEIETHSITGFDYLTPGEVMLLHDNEDIYVGLSDLTKDSMKMVLDALIDPNAIWEVCDRFSDEDFYKIPYSQLNQS